MRETVLCHDDDDDDDDDDDKRSSASKESSRRRNCLRRNGRRTANSLRICIYICPYTQLPISMSGCSCYRPSRALVREPDGIRGFYRLFIIDVAIIHNRCGQVSKICFTAIVPNRCGQVSKICFTVDCVPEVPVLADAV